MKFNDLSPKAQELYKMLDDLQSSVTLSISEMAYDSAMDDHLSDAKRRAYWEVYEYAKQPVYDQQ